MCCSRVFYKDWPVTHSGLNPVPLVILETTKKVELENSMAGLMNSPHGGTILIGCTLKRKVKNSPPIIASVLGKYRSGENQEKLEEQF